MGTENVIFLGEKSTFHMKRYFFQRTYFLIEFGLYRESDKGYVRGKKNCNDSNIGSDQLCARTPTKS
jgi:hypothetical protein